MRYARSKVSIDASFAILKGTAMSTGGGSAEAPSPGVERRMAGPAFCRTMVRST